MFTSEEKNYYKQIKAPNTLRARIHEIEVPQRTFSYRQGLAFACCVVLMLFSFNLFNQDLVLSFNDQVLSDKPINVINPSVMMFRSSNPSITIETNHNISINEHDGMVKYDSHHIYWTIDEVEEDATYSLNLSSRNKDYQVLLTYDEESANYTISVHLIEKGE